MSFAPVLGAEIALAEADRIGNWGNQTLVAVEAGIVSAGLGKGCSVDFGR